MTLAHPTGKRGAPFLPSTMSPISRKTRHSLEYAGFRSAEALFATLPVERASALSGAAWRLAAPRLSRHKRALAHLRQALPERTEAEREAIALDMWDCLGRVFAESFHLDELVGPDRLEIVNENFWRAEAARARGRGFVVCAPHLGNWEIAAGGLGRLGMSPAGVYQKITNPLVDARIHDLRAGFYPGGLRAKGPGTARKLLRVLREGKSVALLADLRDPTGVRVPFFGQEAQTTKFPALLARTLDVPLLAGRVVRLPNAHFRADLERIDVPRTKDSEADMVAAMTQVQRVFEGWIRETPGQWMWAHRRWG